MKVIPLKKARMQLGTLVRGGEPVWISDRGKLVAQLLPVGAKRKRLVDVAGILEGPGDASVNHDHYLHGTAKRMKRK